MPDEPTLLVAMAVRNGEAFLERSLETLRAQTFTGFTAYVVDNGSRDRSREIVMDIARGDARFVLLTRQRPGLADCLRLAIAQKPSRYIARLDADDLSSPERFAIQIAALESDKALAMVGSQAWRIDPEGRVFGSITYPCDDSEIRRRINVSNPFCHSSVMIRRQAYESAGGYRAGMRYGEDWDLWMRIARHGKLANCADRLVSHRMHPSSLTQRNPARFMIAGTVLQAASIQFSRSPTADPTHRLRLCEALKLTRTTRAELRRKIAWLKLRHLVKAAWFRIGALPIIGRILSPDPS